MTDFPKKYPWIGESFHKNFHRALTPEPILPSSEQNFFSFAFCNNFAHGNIYDVSECYKRKAKPTRPSLRTGLKMWMNMNISGTITLKVEYDQNWVMFWIVCQQYLISLRYNEYVDWYKASNFWDTTNSEIRKICSSIKHIIFFQLYHHGIQRLKPLSKTVIIGHKNPSKRTNKMINFKLYLRNFEFTSSECYPDEMKHCSSLYTVYRAEMMKS